MHKHIVEASAGALEHRDQVGRDAELDVGVVAIPLLVLQPLSDGPVMAIAIMAIPVQVPLLELSDLPGLMALVVVVLGEVPAPVLAGVPLEARDGVAGRDVGRQFQDLPDAGFVLVGARFARKLKALLVRNSLRNIGPAV